MFEENPGRQVEKITFAFPQLKEFSKVCLLPTSVENVASKKPFPIWTKLCKD
jgi:hypothetical protein